MLETKVISSLGKVFPDKVTGEEIKEYSAFCDEPVSFQIAFKTSDNALNRRFYVEVETDAQYWEEYKVGYVPVLQADKPEADQFFDSKEPGIFPDPLHERKTKTDIVTISYPWLDLQFEENQTQPLNASNAWQALWFTVGSKEKPLSKGVHEFTVKFRLAEDKRVLATNTVKIDVNGYLLGKQSLVYTAWFHCDCLADIYNVEMFSSRHFEIMENFIKAAAKTGMNMILLPAFTPPLDTPIGRERKTAQLVGVEKTEKGYAFDFTLFEKFVNMCKNAGIEYFEHSHLFTQWGAEFAPKVVAKVNGEYRRIFGWETKAAGEEYKEFLSQYIAALKPQLKKLSIDDKIYFHISDEPAKVHLPTYKESSKIARPLLEGYKVFDALSHYDVYKESDIDIPVVVETSPDMQDFLDNVKDLWVYYTGGEIKKGEPNRLVSTISVRNRNLGIKMYAKGVKGFLNWGYNNYYDIQSQGVIDPRNNPCCFANSSGGFVVYPNCDGTPLITLRMKVFYEGINDYEALRRFEEIKGKEEARKLIEKHFGKVEFTGCFFDEKKIFDFRREMNEILK